MTASSALRPYKGIHRRLLLTLLLLALTPLIALGLFSIDRINSTYNEKISASLGAVADSTHRALDTFMVERVAQMKNLSFIHSYGDLTDTARLSEIFSIMKSNSASFVDLGIIGMDGRHIAYVGPFDLKDANYAETAWFQAVLRKGVYVSDVFMGYRQVPHFIIAVLRHEHGRSYIVRATIDMAAVDKLLHPALPDRYSDAFLVNNKGILQTDSLHHGKSMDTFSLPCFHEHKDSPLPVPFLSQDTQGRPILAAMLRLRSQPWVLVVVADVSSSLQPMHQLRWLIIVFMVGGSVLVVGGALWATRSLVSSLAEADRKQAHLDAKVLQSCKMAALGKMAAGVAHEVNNPLMLIQENAGWIRDLLADEKPEHMVNFAEIKESTLNIERSVQRAKGITQRMLGFGRRMNPSRTEVQINALVTESLEMLKTEAAHRNISIEQDFNPQLPVILSDPAQLQQVFINIIDNAIDAIGKNGRILCSTTAMDDAVRIAFSDTGQGMDAETCQKIFDPFFTTKAVGEGTGLGLAICYNIMEKLGGRIEVQSEPGKGTTFFLTVPCEPVSPAPHSTFAS